MKLWNIGKPDMILLNGSVYSADENDTLYEAIALSGDRVLALGTSEEIKALAGNTDEDNSTSKDNSTDEDSSTDEADDAVKVIDLKGRTVIPGINDAHNHIWEAGLMYDGLVLFGIDSIELLKERIRERAEQLPPGDWIQGGSWIESQFAENRAPNRYDLDAAAPDNAVVLERIFGACTVSSRALKAAGITKETPDPEKGKIERDPETGEPTGVLFGNAVLLVRAAMPGPFGSDEFGAQNSEPSVELMEKAVLRGLEEYKKYGITSVTEPGVSATVCRAYHNILDAGKLSCRIALMPNWYGFTLRQDDEQLSRLIGSYQFHSGYGNEWIRYGGLKMAVDGGLTSGTALKSWPYKGETELRQFDLRLDLNKLDDYIKTAHDSGWDIGIHVMGDVAIQRAVDAIYNAVKANPREHRHSIIHAYYPSEDVLKKMAEAGILAAAQASFLYGEADGYDALLPKEKQETFTPLRSYKEAGVTVALSTDMPCADVNPFWNLYAAVTRKGMRGYCLGTKEAITVAEGVKMMTYNGAVLNREEDIKGSLEPGKLADLAILDRGLPGLDPEKLREIKVDATILNGRIIYERTPQQ